MSKSLVTWVFWLCLATAFTTLRWDNSDRLYFLADDNVVAWLADDIQRTGNWQPDWYRAAAGVKRDEYFERESANFDIPHEHHYNFTAQILAGAIVVKLAHAVGIEASTASLLHHLSFFWDCLSLLCVIGAAYQIGNAPLARIAAVLYAFFPLAVQGAHYARPDALLTAVGSASLWLALLYSRWPAHRWLMVNALVLAIGILGKASQLMMGIFPALAFLHALQTGPVWQRAWSRLFLQGLALLVSIITLLSLAFAACDISWHDFIVSTQSIMLYYQHPSPQDTLEHHSWASQLLNILHYFYATLGAPWLLTMVLGGVALWRTQRFTSLVLAVPLLIFTAYFASVPAFFDRNFCSSAAAIVLLAAAGIRWMIDKTKQYTVTAAVVSVALALMVSYQTITINYQLYTDHLNQHHNDDRLAFQKQLKEGWPGFWLKSVDRSDLFGRSLPERPAKTPRIYVVEDFNDWNSRDYAQQLRDNGFVQIAEFTGDFANIPTSSLLTVHEAARFRYFIRRDEWPVDKPLR